MGPDFRLGEPDQGGQLPESKLVLTPELLGQPDPLRTVQTPWIASPEHLLAGVSAQHPGLLVLEVHTSLLRHFGQHRLFPLLGAGQEHPEPVVGAIDRFEPGDVYIVGRKNQPVADQPVIWNCLFPGGEQRPSLAGAQ